MKQNIITFEVPQEIFEERSKKSVVTMSAMSMLLQTDYVQKILMKE